MPNTNDADYVQRDALQGKRVLVAMSGGVDSSVAAALLADAGAEVCGATFKNFCFSGGDALPGRSCCSVDAVADALAVCRRLGIDHVLVDETERFGAEVLDHFEGEYRAGRTPNPCVRCNAQVRFPRLLEDAAARGFDFVATGHYARIVDDGGRLFLARGLHDEKDQSYFLAGLDPASYARVRFPLGELAKPAVRRLAAERGLPVHDKRESQDVCFMAGRSLREYLSERGRLTPGLIVDARGEKLGEHAGVELFTIGQRHGLGVAASRPLFVTALDAASGTVTLGAEADLLARELECIDAWVAPDLDAGGLSAKIRYRSPAQAVADAALAGGRLRVRFAEPVKAAAPGQSLVIYRGDRVLGHGVIAAVR